MGPMSRKKPSAQHSETKPAQKKCNTCRLSGLGHFRLVSGCIRVLSDITSVDSNRAFGFIAHVPSLAVLA